MRRHTFFLLVTVLIGSSVSVQALESPSISGALVEEVISEYKQKPNTFDWRNYLLQVELGYTSLQERNSFTSSSYNMGLSTGLGGPWIGRLEARKVTTDASNSSNLLASTPFSQAAQPSRYEFLAGAGYALLDGRSATALSPRLTDIQHALYGLFGLQYNYYGNRDPEPLPAMRAIYYDYVAEVGLRWQIFLPHNLGVGFEWTYSIPVRNADADLASWQRYSGSLAWTFGD